MHAKDTYVPGYHILKFLPVYLLMAAFEMMCIVLFITYIYIYNIQLLLLLKS
jgi:hypothetical protein